MHNMYLLVIALLWNATQAEVNHVDNQIIKNAANASGPDAVQVHHRRRSSSGCPHDFPHAGHDPAGIWGVGQGTGACQGDKSFPSALRDSAFCFNGKGGIDVDLGRAPKNHDTKGCMSFGTRSCPMWKGDIKEIQFKASTSGCFSGSDKVWACPLWLTPQHWIAPQSKSGEVDFMERCGNNGGNGMAWNFGPGAGNGQSSFPIPGEISKSSVYYFKFNSHDHGKGDSVEGWKCSDSANPIEHGTKGCHHIGTNHGYYARTHHDHGDKAANTFEMITDIWNVPSAKAGSCTPSGASFHNRKCKYRVHDLKTTFYKTPSWNSACRTHLLAKKSEMSLNETVIV